MMCTWEAIFFANATAMLNGGPPTLFWGFVFAFCGALTTAASLAELASIWPTSGGQYHWTAMLAPPSQRVVLSWFCGRSSATDQPSLCHIWLNLSSHRLDCDSRMGCERRRRCILCSDDGHRNLRPE